MAEVNTGLAPDRRISFRIGIHIGDVMVRGGDMFGDGVNIAARLQALAQPSSVCVSGATYEQVKKVLPLSFTDLGPQQVKNVEEPIRAYVAGRLVDTPSAATFANASKSLAAARQTIHRGAAVPEHER